MAHAYTPGLKVSRTELVRKTRRLPLKGEVLVEVGEIVGPGQVVARTEIPGDPVSINIANLLSVEPADIVDDLLVSEGDDVEEDQVIGRTAGWFGLFRRDLKSPLTGTLEMVSPVSGQAVFRKKPVPLEVYGYVHGKVAEVIPEEGVVIEAVGAFIQGIFGVGGERLGRIRVLASSPDARISPTDIGEDCRDCIIVAGALATSDMLIRAAEVGAVAVVAGGVIDEDLVDYLGYDIGVAITGHEDIPVTMLVTEGFGPMAIAGKTFDLLVDLEGSTASVNGATQIRAGVMRPEIIVPDVQLGADDVAIADSAGGLDVGTPVRIIREPHFGALAEVTELPPALQEVESEARVRVLKARLEDGTEVTVPRANVEIIEG